jgi:8-oxo-dGTP pyrophosphatase MutT (NUDIX family)
MGKTKATKVYGIIHDGSKVLVGTGGQSGNPARLRQGYHFVGGTREKDPTKAGISKNPPLEHLQNTVIREAREEAGITLPDNTPWDQVTAANFKGTGVPAKVAFITMKVASVDALVGAFQRPAVLNRNDEPFQAIQAVVILAALIDQTNFSTAYNTSWFGEALKVADKQGLLR